VVQLRALTWSLVCASALFAAAVVLGQRSSAALAAGRERLLAGDAPAADAAFARARFWPPGRASARAGAALAGALRGRPGLEPAAGPVSDDLAAVAVLESALARGDGGAAAALAGVALAAGEPLGPLYAAAFALETGDAERARSLASRSRVPLEARAAGQRLQETLRLHDAGASAVVRDRNGRLVGSLDAGGAFRLAPGVEADLVPVPTRDAVAALAPAPGLSGIRLDLDLGLSALARRALGGERGTIVLLEPRTGGVLAAVSDERTARSEGDAAFTQRREPASIAKILTTAAAYRAGIDADAAIRAMSCEGVALYGGEPLWCPTPVGPLRGLDQALAISCNIAFANLALEIGAHRLLEEFALWGFDSGALLGTAGHVRRQPGRPRELADLSVGLEVVDVTPLHAALLAATVAGDGRLPEPRLVASRCGPLGLSDGHAAVRSSRAVVDDATTLTALRRAMEAVALYGTGAALAPGGFPIAMKTGTAAEWRRGYHVNYVGYAPTRDPSVVFCVRVTQRPSSWSVNRAARDVTRRLLRGLADRRAGLARAAERQRRP
jgi:peptidoglycan glycosyltransferase